MVHTYGYTYCCYAFIFNIHRNKLVQTNIKALSAANIYPTKRKKAFFVKRSIFFFFQWQNDAATAFIDCFLKIGLFTSKDNVLFCF